MTHIEVSEVGPRDGLQILKRFVPTEVKKRWIAAEAAAGVREIEVCSFVPPKLVPQFVDADEVVAFARTIPGLAVAVLVPNLKGAERAVAAKAHKLSLTISVSRGHSLANVRKTPEEQIGELRRIVELARAQPADGRPQVSAGLSTVFGCSIEGRVSEDAVERLAVMAMEAGADDLGLADTVGYANPAQITRVFKRVRRAVGDKVVLGAHLHDTFGLGLANAAAALDCGVTTLDSSLAGIGGCPYAPGASGNIATEDLCYMLESMGFTTGIDLDRLLEVRAELAQGLPDVTLHGRVGATGLPKSFRMPEPAAA